MENQPDLSKLEYFTAAALTGFCSQYVRGQPHNSPKDLAELSVKTAWQVMKQLGLTNKDTKDFPDGLW